MKTAKWLDKFSVGERVFLALGFAGLILAFVIGYHVDNPGRQVELEKVSEIRIQVPEKELNLTIYTDGDITLVVE